MFPLYLHFITPAVIKNHAQVVLPYLVITGVAFTRYQTGLTQMADTVIGGSTGLGLSGGQVSC